MSAENDLNGVRFTTGNKNNGKLQVFCIEQESSVYKVKIYDVDDPLTKVEWNPDDIEPHFEDGSWQKINVN